MNHSYSPFNIFIFRWLLATSLQLLPLSSWAQSWDQIKDSRSYLWAEGHGATVAEADERALANLISQISVQVESSFTQTDMQTTANGDMEARQQVKAVVNTYSQATLTGTERLIVKNEPDAIVGRFILRSEVNRIFENRKPKINEFVRLAQNAQAQLRIDDALRYYYWAYALTRSLPHANEFRLSDAEGNTHVAMAWLPEQLNAIFTQLKASVTSLPDDEGNLSLRFTFGGSPVTSIDYSCFDGQDWSNIYSAREGCGVLELMPGTRPSAVQVKYEYAYKGQALMDKEMQSVLNALPGTALPKSYVMVPLHAAVVPPSPVAPMGSAEHQTRSMVEQVTTAHVAQEVQPLNTDNYSRSLNQVISAIRTRSYASVKHLFTPEGYEMFDRLIHYGQARLLQAHPQLDFFKLREEVIARSVPMSFRFAHGVRKEFVENVNFTFAPDGRINAVSFAISNRTWADVMSKDRWPVTSRMTIIQFLENYKTAYALKRWDYLNEIFDDNALIIVGSVLHRLQGTGRDDMHYQDNPIVRQNRLSKSEYMRNLKRCFDSNEFVNIRFTDTDVKKGRPDIDDYGIQIKQDYYSSSYGDTGYLFLRVDINNPDEPIIRVRTWQPRITSIDDLIDLNSF